MKPLGQIAYDAAWPEDAPAAWPRESQFSKNRWEAAAQAVREAVLEEISKDAEEWGNALNDAGWEFFEAVRRHTGEPTTTAQWNHGKAIIRDVILCYLKAPK